MSFCSLLCPQSTAELFRQIAPPLITAVVSGFGIFFTYKSATRALDNAAALSQKAFFRTQYKELERTFLQIMRHIEGNGDYKDKNFQGLIIDAQFLMQPFRIKDHKLYSVLETLRSSTTTDEISSSFRMNSSDFLNSASEDFSS